MKFRAHFLYLSPSPLSSSVLSFLLCVFLSFSLSLTLAISPLSAYRAAFLRVHARVVERPVVHLSEYALQDQRAHSGLIVAVALHIATHLDRQPVVHQPAAGLIVSHHKHICEG